MSHLERTGVRSLLASGWHRPARIRRYLSARQAALLSVIDIDFCEYCTFCHEPLALIETEQSAVRETPKDAPVMSRLAEMAGIPAYSATCVTNETGDDIDLWRVRQLVPVAGAVLVMLPAVYANWLWALHSRHCAELHVPAA